MSVKYPFSPKEFELIYSKVPRLTVEVVVLTKKGVILTLRTLKSWNNLWHIPGGTVFYKETLEEAVLRVARDELGIKVQIKKLLGYLYYPSEEKERGFGWTIGLAFLCSISSGKLRSGNQAKRIGIFKKIPENSIKEAKIFLEENIKILSSF